MGNIYFFMGNVCFWIGKVYSWMSKLCAWMGTNLMSKKQHNYFTFAVNYAFTFGVTSVYA